MSASQPTPKQNSDTTAQPERTSNHGRPYSNASERLDITKDEFQRISDALKKEEFRKLFMDYIEEIQDPNNRKIYEDEITQIEAERGVDITFINPEPGFVIRTSQDGNQKCFINCAQSAKIEKPKNESSEDPVTGQRGISWAIPLSQAPPRDDLDSNNKRCRVYDVVFHPETLYLAERSKAFHDCLVETALDAVEREFKVKLDRVNLTFPKMTYKGVAQPTVIRKLAKSASKEAVEPHPLESIYPPRPTVDSSKPKVLPMKAMNRDNNANNIPEYNVPKYIIKHRHNVDMSEYTHELDAKLSVTIPKELIIEIELPLLKSSTDCILDVTENSLQLLNDCPGAKYRLNIHLPYSVKSEDGNATFDSDTRRLTIELPVIQLTNKEKANMHKHLMALNAEENDNQCNDNAQHQNDVSNNDDDATPRPSMDEELNDELKIIDNVDEVSVSNGNCDSETENVDEEQILAMIDKPFLKPDIDYQFPDKFDCRALKDGYLQWTWRVLNVQTDSLYIRQKCRNLHLRFMSIGAGYFPTFYAFYIQLPDHCSTIQIINADAKTEDDDVILNVCLNNDSKEITSYLAGIDENNMNLYKICKKKIRVKHVSRQPRSSNDISDINDTTKDDSTTIEMQGIKDQQSKKWSRRARRKSRAPTKRRPSESSCDDREAHPQQHHQQKQQQQKQQQKVGETVDENKNSSLEDSSEEPSKPIPISIPNGNSGARDFNNAVDTNISTSKNIALSNQQRKHRSFSESRDSGLSSCGNSTSYKGILKHYSRYDGSGRPSISNSYSSMDDSLSNPSTSLDGMANSLNTLGFSQSISDIPEENVAGSLNLSESCKKTVRFSEVIRKQVFRMDSSILGQRKKNQKQRNRKRRALQRRLSEGDSADYEQDRKLLDTPPIKHLSDEYNDIDYKNQLNHNINNDNENKNSDNSIKCNNYKEQNDRENGKGKNNGDINISNNNMRPRLDSESSSDTDANKNSLMFHMDM